MLGGSSNYIFFFKSQRNNAFVFPEMTQFALWCAPLNVSVWPSCPALFFTCKDAPVAPLINLSPDFPVSKSNCTSFPSLERWVKNWTFLSQLSPTSRTPTTTTKKSNNDNYTPFSQRVLQVRVLQARSREGYGLTHYCTEEKPEIRVQQSARVCVNWKGFLTHQGQFSPALFIYVSVSRTLLCIAR